MSSPALLGLKNGVSNRLDSTHKRLGRPYQQCPTTLSTRHRCQFRPALWQYPETHRSRSPSVVPYRSQSWDPEACQTQAPPSTWRASLRSQHRGGGGRGGRDNLSFGGLVCAGNPVSQIFMQETSGRQGVRASGRQGDRLQASCCVWNKGCGIQCPDLGCCQVLEEAWKNKNGRPQGWSDRGF